MSTASALNPGEPLDAKAVVDRGFWDGLRCDPILSVSEWADENRILSRAAESGRYRTDRTPYVREIQDALGSNATDVETVVVMAGAQVAKTTMGENWLGYAIHHSPAPFLFVEPTVDMAKRVSKQRVQPMIDDCPSLADLVKPPRSRDSGNTILEKEFPGGSLVMTGANSAIALRQTAIRRVFFDEIDGYPLDLDGEGDPVELARRRTATYRRNRKILMTSTPTEKGASAIEKAFERTDKRYFFVPCPECGGVAPILWRNIVWEKENEDEPDVPTKHKPETAALRCESCEATIPDRKKTWMLARGEWVATSNEGEPGMRGYHLSSLYSPFGWYSWEDAVRDFLEAKRVGPEKMKTWVNTVLGETWEEEGEKIDADVLMSRREVYALAEDSEVRVRVPEKVLVLTAGLDVQQNRIEAEVVGWGHGEEAFAIDYRVFHGENDRPEVWEKVRTFLEGTYTWANSEIRLPISTAAIDAGAYTQMVYSFVRTGPSNCYAVHGAAGAGRPIVARIMKKRSGATKAKVFVYTVGTDGAKDLLFGRLRRSESGAGACHWPIDHPSFGSDYFAQLTAEKRITVYERGFPKHAWVKIRPRNEALDCRVYATAALYILNPAFDEFERAIQEAVDAEKPKKKERDPTSLPPRGGDDWISGW